VPIVLMGILLLILGMIMKFLELMDSVKFAVLIEYAFIGGIPELLPHTKRL